MSEREELQKAKLKQFNPAWRAQSGSGGSGEQRMSRVQLQGSQLWKNKWMGALKSVFPAVCFESCLLLAGYNLLFKAHMQNIENISGITQKSKLYQGLCCPSRPGLRLNSKHRIFTITIFTIFIQDVELTRGFSTHRIALFIFIQLSDTFGHQLLAEFSCSVTSPVQRKLLLLKIQIFHCQCHG